MEWGTVQVAPVHGGHYRHVVYAAAVKGNESSLHIVSQIGRALGRLAEGLEARTVKAPLLGSGAGGLNPSASAEAISRGFLSTAPRGAMLILSILDRTVLNLLGTPPSSGERRWEGHQRPAEPAFHESAPHVAPTGESDRNRVFISYSHEDKEWLERLQRHLRPLERAGALVWDDTRLQPGTPWREEIRKALAQTKIAILLISADFLSSEFIATNELPPLLAAAEDEGATILPVIVSHCRFVREESLSRFQAVNDPEKPLVQLGRANREKVLDQVARAVEDALKK
jgi:nucleotide-binding universal stress UspA family protein